jgi:hypothetical protein
LRALRRRFFFDSSRIFLKRFKSFWFKVLPPRNAAARLGAMGSSLPQKTGKKEAEY